MKKVVSDEEERIFSNPMNARSEYRLRNRKQEIHKYVPGYLVEKKTLTSSYLTQKNVGLESLELWDSSLPVRCADKNL